MSTVEESTIVVASRMEPELRDQLARKAREEDRSMSGTVRHAVRLYLSEPQAARESRVAATG